MMLDFQSLAQAAAGRGLNTLLDGFVLAGMSWVALRASKASSSMTRFAVWFSTLLVITALPFLAVSRISGVGATFHTPELTLSSSLATRIFLAWAVIASIFLLRLGISLHHVYKIRHACKQIESAAYPSLREVAGQFSSRHIKLLVSDEVRIPTALGFFRPAVVIPAWTLRDLSGDELKVILLHELAHLRRGDNWTNLAQQLAKALFFFHPVVWWIDNRLAFEREIACDDLVLEQTSSARAYAASLVSVAEKVIAGKMLKGKALALAQSALGRVREVSLRVARILDGRPRPNRAWRPAVAMIGTLAILTVVGMPYAPELVSFNGKTEPTFSAKSNGTGSAQVVPASLRWSSSTVPAPRRLVTARTREVHRTNYPAVVSPKVIPVRAMQRAHDHQPKLVIAKAAQQNKPAETLLVFRSTQVDEFGVPVWTLSVWRMKSPNGQTIQEMIVMNSI
ncbi:MAG TPA: M56 family metallopeptidase [Terriglobales bacterium]|nr:M56 family metallopeptidase [Terriglobales bacterium]